MKWFRHIFQAGRKDSDAELQTVQNQFTHFLALLDQNNRVLKIIAEMEEMSQGEYLFDLNYIRTSLAEIRSGVREILEHMIALGGESYATLRERYAAINAEIEKVLPENQSLGEDDYTIPLEQLGWERGGSVGSKNARLGELKKLGLPVPEGFAISAWAYKHFVEANGLQARITEYLQDLDPQCYEDLVRVSEEIRALVLASPVPEDLAEALRRSYADLIEGWERDGDRSLPLPIADCQSPDSGKSQIANRKSQIGHGVALRSSALGEDTLFSFAGQYKTFLNVRGDELVERYREILASKFTPQAIYYFLSHALSEAELAMSVGCLAMVDAAASGVIYTQDPVQPEDDCVLVSSIYGLGSYLVSGTLTPDCFRLARQDGSIREIQLAKKPVRLVLQPGGGTVEEPVPVEEQELPSVGEEALRLLTAWAVQIEEHYGHPQDIEWALDRRGRLFLLQTRPLRVVQVRGDVPIPDVSGLEVLRSGGTTICPGAGAGPVFHAASLQDLAPIPEGVVLVARYPFPGLVTVMGQINALVTEVGGVASHAATLAREYRVPTLMGVERALELPAGQEVTVDATGATLYAGRQPELMAARRPEAESLEDLAIFQILERILAQVSPLNLLHPADPDFTIENSRSFHDLTRFAHQKAMQEMFSGARRMKHKEQLGVRLRSELPLQVHIIYLDQHPSAHSKKRWVNEEEIASVPMQAFWKGIKEEGWPTQPPPADLEGFMSVLTTHLTTAERPGLTEDSFAILSQEYMILSLYLGYHFTTVEAMFTPEPSKNYIRMQHKGGGASLDRRIRRIQLITGLLARMGFENSSQGDFLEASVSYLSPERLLEKLRLLGRLTMITKQLDVALSDESVVQRHFQDCWKKLGLPEGAEGNL
jgi:pyruvate,water dikinase